LFYIANVLLLQWAQLTKIVHTTRLGLEFVFVFFGLHDLSVYFVLCFVLPWSVESFPFVFWRWRNKLKWVPVDSSYYFGLGAGSTPFRAIVYKKHYWIRDVQDFHDVSASGMAYIVSGGALNSTRSLTLTWRLRMTEFLSGLLQKDPRRGSPRFVTEGRRSMTKSGLALLCLFCLDLLSCIELCIFCVIWFCLLSWYVLCRRVSSTKTRLKSHLL